VSAFLKQTKTVTVSAETDEHSLLSDIFLNDATSINF